MRQVAAVIAFVWSLFVDDGLFAASILAWLASSYMLSLADFESGWRGVLLFGGLGLILIHGARRKTRSG